MSSSVAKSFRRVETTAAETPDVGEVGVDGEVGDDEPGEVGDVGDVGFSDDGLAGMDTSNCPPVAS
jgi:hypothetical protein